MVSENLFMFQNCVILDSNKTFRKEREDTLMFQNCVILDSNKTYWKNEGIATKFQNCVILDSNKTGHCISLKFVLFQNCVILDSNKTYKINEASSNCDTSNITIAHFSNKPTSTNRILQNNQNIKDEFQNCYSRQQ